MSGIKTRNLRQEINLLKKIAHHNNAPHPCPSQHHRSLFGKRTLTFHCLPSPGQVTTTTTDTTLTAEWVEEFGANSYEIMLIDAQGNIIELLEAPNSVSTYTFMNLNPETEYTTVITGLDANGNKFPIGQATDTTQASGKDNSKQNICHPK